MSQQPWLPCLVCGELIWGTRVCVEHALQPRRGQVGDQALAPYLAPPFRAGLDPYGKRRTIRAYGAQSTVSGGLPSLGKRY